MRKVLLAVPIFLSLLGCAHIAQQQAAQDWATVGSVCAAAENDPRLAPLRPDVPNDAEAATIQQLSNPNAFSAAQKQALSDFDAAVGPCFEVAAAYLRKWDASGVVDAYLAQLQRAKLLRAAAWRGDLNIGQYNTARAESLSRFTRESEEARRIHAQNEATAAAQRAAAWGAISQSLQQAQQTQIMRQQLHQQQMQSIQNSYQMSRPVQTNCYRYGNQVNCTSY